MHVSRGGNGWRIRTTTTLVFVFRYIESVCQDHSIPQKCDTYCKCSVAVARQYNKLYLVIHIIRLVKSETKPKRYIVDYEQQKFKGSTTLITTSAVWLVAKPQPRHQVFNSLITCFLKLPAARNHLAVSLASRGIAKRLRSLAGCTKAPEGVVKYLAVWIEIVLF